MSPQLVFLIRGQVLALSGKDLEEKIVCTGHQEAGSHPLEAPGVPSQASQDLGFWPPPHPWNGCG